MVRTTEGVWKRLRPLGLLWHVSGTLLLVPALVGVLLIATGCSKSTTPNGNGVSSEATATQSGQMAGPAVEVHIPQSAVDDSPAPWNLRTPESAVRSYLDWITYAYRIGQSDVATPTMSAAEEVRVDSYNQYNLEKSRLVDQTLKAITFGKVSTGATSTLLPAKESWTYSYLFVAEGNKVIAGPYSADYDTTYTLVKNDKGEWVVDSVAAKAQGTVK